MNTYFVLHTYSKTPQEFADAFTEEKMAEFARAMAEGQAPAKCTKTWDPTPHGRGDYVFCLWEAEKPEDVEAAMGGFGLLEYLTADIMQVDETDWEQVAKAAG